MKYAVLGAAGQLGRDLCPRLAGDVTPLVRTQADLTQLQMLRQTLTTLQPDVVVNCAAYNFVDRAESEPDIAMAVNAWGVKALAEICRDLDCTLVHFSTDYVFGLDTARRTPYRPADAPGPLSVYGLSKLAGEYFARTIALRHFVIRTCGLYGLPSRSALAPGETTTGKGGNFIETMLRLAGQAKPLRVVADQECTPSYTADVAEAAATLIQTQQYGLHHLTNAGSCSWFELARTAFELEGKKVEMEPIGSTEWKSAARRPAYSVLACEIALRPWRQALAAYISARRLSPAPAS